MFGSAYSTDILDMSNTDYYIADTDSNYSENIGFDTVGSTDMYSRYWY